MADPIRQLLSQTSYVADGSQTVWNFSFSGGYIDKSHVKAKYLDAARVEHQIDVTPGMFLGQYQLNITPPIAAGSELVIYRDTPKEGPLVDFIDAASLTEASLDLSAKQGVFVAAESSDGWTTIIEATNADRLQTGEDRTAARDSAANALTSENAASDKEAEASGHANAASGQAVLAANAAATTQTLRDSIITTQGSIGYLPPVAYAAGLSMTLPAQTVNYAGQAYAPLLLALPFTTSGAFETAKFRLIQGVAAVDLAAAGGAGMVGVIQAGVGAIARTLQDKLRETVSVKDFGAVGDGVTDDTTSLLSAFNWLNASPYRKIQGVQGKFYKVTSTLPMVRSSSVFDGGNCAFYNAIPNKEPLFKLDNIGANNLTLKNFKVFGLGSPGHIIAIFGDASGSPSFINIENVTVSGNTGTGLDRSGADVPAHFIYMQGGMSLRVHNCAVGIVSGGIRLEGVQKVSITATTIDGVTAAVSLYASGCRNVVVSAGCVFNGGIGDQCHFVGNTSVSITGCRFKGSAGRLVFVEAPSTGFIFEENNLEIYNYTTSAIVISTGCGGVSVSKNNLLFVNNGGAESYTQAGIDVVDMVGGGHISYGGVIASNTFTMSSNLTLTAGIRISTSLNPARGWEIKHNDIGNLATNAVMGTAILLTGNQLETRVINNIIGMAGSGSSTAIGISLSPSVVGAVVMGTMTKGIVTTIIADSSAKSIRETAGIWASNAFTPVVYGGSSPGTATYTVQAGKYSKIGNLVFYNISLSWSGHTGVGDLRISGMPFQFSSTTNQMQVGTILASNLTFTGQLAAYSNGGASFLRLASFASGTALAFVPMGAGADLHITGWYEIN